MDGNSAEYTLMVRDHTVPFRDYITRLQKPRYAGYFYDLHCASANEPLYWWQGNFEFQSTYLYFQSIVL